MRMGSWLRLWAKVPWSVSCLPIKIYVVRGFLFCDILRFCAPSPSLESAVGFKSYGVCEFHTHKIYLFLGGFCFVAYGL